MTIRLDTQVEWAGPETFKAWTALMPPLRQAYAQMYSGDESEAQDIPVEVFTAPKGRLFVVRVAEDLVGMGGWSWVRHLGKKDYPEEWWVDTAEIKRVFVRPEYQGLGLGKSLNKALINDAREHGVKRLVAETGEPQTVAVLLYHSLGYERIGPFGAIDTAAESCFFGMDL